MVPEGFGGDRFIRDCVRHCVEVGDRLLEEKGDGEFKEILKKFDSSSYGSSFVHTLAKPLNMALYEPSWREAWKDGRIVKEPTRYDAVDLCVANAVGALSLDEQKRFKIGVYAELGYDRTDASCFLGLMKWLAASVDKLWALRSFLPDELERIDEEWRSRSKSGGAA